MRRIVVVAAGLALLGAAPPALGLPQEAPASAPAESTGAAIDAAIAAVLQAVSSLPAGTSADDAEAAIAYALDQSQAQPGIIVAALDTLDTSGMSRSIRAALVNIRRLKQRYACNTVERRKRFGTGSVGTGAVGTGTIGTGAVAPQWQYRQIAGCDGGTGSIAAGQQPSFGSAPGIGSGGGTANYTSPAS